MKKVIVLLLLASFTFAFSVSAQGNVDNLHTDISVEEDGIVIDLSHVVLRKEMKFNANYENDYDDLLSQFLEQSEAYKNVESMLNSKDITIDEKTELETRKDFLLRRFKSDVESLLETRYNDDKKGLRLDIESFNEPISTFADQFFYKTWDTGTFGVVEKSGATSKASYQHHKMYNRSWGYVKSAYLAADASIRNGITFGSLYNERADIKFREVTVGANLGCVGSNTYAEINVDAIIYNGFTNQIVGYHNFLNGLCDKDEGKLYLDIQPHYISFTNVPIGAAPMQVYTSTYVAAAMAGGLVDAGQMYGGVSWGKIEITKVN